MTASVYLKRGDFVDEGRNRKIPYKLYHPENTGGKLPLIIWSHGYGGNRDGAGFIARHIAAHGYILLHLTHIGSDSSLWEGKPGHPWDILRNIKITPDMMLERFKDVPFALDQLEAGNFEHTDILAQTDLNNIGMSGHSFGSLTTQVMAGQKFPTNTGGLARMKEPRFKAGIAYSPLPLFHLSDASPQDLYGDIDIPLFHMTGTDDNSPIEGFDYQNRLTIHEYSEKADKYMMILDGGDHMVYNGTRGQLGENPNREAHEDIIKTASLHFWDAYLKANPASLDWLRTNYK